MSSVTQADGSVLRFGEWRDRKLADLIQYIVAKHHEYLRGELPAMEGMLASERGNRQSHEDELIKVFRQFSRGMLNHMQKEEMILFPMIERLESARMAGQEPPALPFGTIEHPIAVMEQEHEQARRELAEIGGLTAGFTQGETSMLQRLSNLNVDMDIHSGLEDNILFPRAVDLEREQTP